MLLGTVSQQVVSGTASVDLIGVAEALQLRRLTWSSGSVAL